jgi:selenide,water dikinase
VKPINRFVDRWHELLQRVLDNSGPHRIAAVGAGAAGVEIILSIQFRLEQILREKKRQSEPLELTLISKSDRILPGFPGGVSKRFLRILDQRGIHVYTNTEATRVTNTSLELSNGNTLDADEILWVTGASAPDWLRDSGLEVDDSGFILANTMLQSTNQADIFAAGDIVHVKNYPRPKAGVFAVRQGKPSTGNQYAIASKAGLHLQGAILWVWKDWIDRHFMQKFSDLPKMDEEQPYDVNRGLADEDTLGAISATAMRCGGCGAKVSATTLSRAISSLTSASRDDILIGLHEPDDAAVVEVPAGKVMVHSVDYFRAFIDDPYLFGQIAANHSLSDIFAMGAEAQSALAIATVPFNIETKVEDTLRQLMTGAMQALNESHTALVGGHTSEGAELALGFSVNGLADREHIMRKGGMQPGDVLILTKALGTGTLFAADMMHKARGRWIDAALESMIQSNRICAEVLHRHKATACTDITGFGLLGHMVEMTRPSCVDVEINLQALPLLDGALETIEMGILSSLQPANLRLRHAIANGDEVVDSPLFPLLFDPQTSGGLLASIPAQLADACLAELSRTGYAKAAVIGRVKVKSDAQEPVTLVG